MIELSLFLVFHYILVNSFCIRIDNGIYFQNYTERVVPAAKLFFSEMVAVFDGNNNVSILSGAIFIVEISNSLWKVMKFSRKRNDVAESSFSQH